MRSQRYNELGFSLLLDLLHHPEDKDVDVVLDDLAAQRVDGIIWAVHEVSASRAWLAPACLAALPPIVLLTMETRPDTAIISTDSRRGALLATRRLLEIGRRRIAIITGPLRWWEACERLAGWQLCLRQARIEPSRALICEGDWTSNSGEQGLRHLLAIQPEIDAVFASNDQMALGGLRAAHLRGRCVPEQFAVAGFDNIPEAAFFWPSLTSVRQHLADLRRMAVEERHRAIEARAEGERITPVVTLISPELIVRGSSTSNAVAC